MMKTIIITGSTDGIGLEAAKSFVAQGHKVILHGRNKDKLERAVAEVSQIATESLPDNSLNRSLNSVDSIQADLTNLKDVKAFSLEIKHKYEKIDVLINNAGIYKSSSPATEDGLDIRFAVNTFAPYLLTLELLPLLKQGARVLNLSSAAQAPINLEVMAGKKQISDQMNLYAQSKLAITIWTQELAKELQENGPLFISVNPGSLLATKMVKEGFGIAGNDINIGSDILLDLALNENHKSKNGCYFDNDIGHYSEPHPEAQNSEKCQAVMDLLKNTVSKYVA